MIEKRWTTKAGLDAICILQEVGSHRCGYVRVDKCHLLHGKGSADNCPELKEAYDKAMNGPIGKRSPIPLLLAAYSDNDEIRLDVLFDIHGGLTFAGKLCKEYDPNQGWWFGFDCAHAGDGFGPFSDGPVRSQEYVEQECESLAQQLSEIKEQLK